MYYTEIDPRDMKPVYVCKNPHEKAMQRALIQYKRPENYDLVKEALMKAGREDLIGFGEECLIPPRKIKGHDFKKSDSKKNSPKKNNSRQKDNNKSNSINNNHARGKNSSKQNKPNERTKNKRKR